MSDPTVLKTTDPSSWNTQTEPHRSSPAELRDHYIRLAKQAETKADQRKAVIRAEQASAIRTSHNARGIRLPDKAAQVELDVWTNKAAEKDPVWKGYVATNQWYIQQAIMFGTAATETAIRELIQLMTASAYNEVIKKYQ